MPEDQERTEATVLGELRDIDRFLREVPPHSSAAGRDDLTSRRERLERELAALRRAQGDDG